MTSIFKPVLSSRIICAFSIIKGVKEYVLLFSDNCMSAIWNDEECFKIGTIRFGTMNSDTFEDERKQVMQCIW